MKWVLIILPLMKFILLQLADNTYLRCLFFLVFLNNLSYIQRDNYILRILHSGIRYNRKKPYVYIYGSAINVYNKVTFFIKASTIVTKNMSINMNVRQVNIASPESVMEKSLEK